MNPSDIPAVNRILKREYRRRKAPIVDLVQAQTRDPFLVLVATILSARTKDETTTAVCKRLFRQVRRPHDFDRFTQRQLEKLLLPIGFFRTKARHLKALPAALDDGFGGRVPDAIDDLCRLPGVGRKTANLVRAVAFNKPAVCVDVHVHRICNRLGLLRTKTPLETEQALRRILPHRYWITWNSYLVSFGQTVCRPVGPHCGACPVARYCDRVGVAAARPAPRAGR
ncbi:MAG: endonuclease III [Lentisphaerae bacterium]|nr:endonuclease III [Lentisphaerota bacterium]